MSMGRVRSVAFSAFCLLWLVGCETQLKLSETWKQSEPSGPPAPSLTDPASVDTTGSIPNVGPVKPDAGLLGADPNDDLNNGKKLYRTGAYGLAERSFRRAAELQPRDAEAWIGLAACYDRLKRFDLADRAYTQALGILGPTPEVLNNQGYSFMLRGQFTRAKTTLLQAKAKDPNNPYVRSNLKLLDEAIRTGRSIEAQ